MTESISTDVKQQQPFGGQYAEIINRLTIKPKEMNLDVHIEQNGSMRHYVKFTYAWTGKLKAFGTFLLDVARDVKQAGGVVVEFTFSPAAGIKPEPSAEFDYNPDGTWDAMFIFARIRTAGEIQDRQESWNATMEYFKERWKQTK